MSAERVTFDTNIFFYAVDFTAKEKSPQALHLLEVADPLRSFVVLQTLGELCFSVGRKRPDLLPSVHRSVRDIAGFFDVVSATLPDLKDALAAQETHKLPFWDAMLWATARRNGCTLLLTEDLQDGRSLGGVTFRNPFVMKPRELDRLVG